MLVATGACTVAIRPLQIVYVRAHSSDADRKHVQRLQFSRLSRKQIHCSCALGN